MDRRIFRLLVMACAVVVCLRMSAAAEWKGYVPDQEFNKILKNYKVNPGALANNGDILRKASYFKEV